MKIEKAIKECQHRIYKGKGDIVFLKKCLGALTKQMPIEPSQIGSINNGYGYDYLCPRCKRHLIMPGEKYCARCGQRVRPKNKPSYYKKDDSND